MSTFSLIAMVLALPPLLILAEWALRFLLLLLTLAAAFIGGVLYLPFASRKRSACSRHLP